MSWELDTEYETHRVERASADKGGWSLDLGGSGIFLTSESCNVAPLPGEEARLYGRGFGYSVRGIIISGRVYRYEAAAEHEVSQAAMCERLRREREEADQRFRDNAASLPPLPTFRATDETGWLECVEKNKADPYSYECVRFAAAWAGLMDSRAIPGVNIADIAEACCREADTSGITGFMYGAAVSMLAKFWVHGDTLRRWHNKETQLGDEGDRANESGGVLNPAILNVGG